MTHSPGPWTVAPSPHDKRVYLVDSKVNGAVGEMVYVDTRKAADACLIAAAPDLLWALEFLVAGIEGGVSETYIPLVKARAAIAKATGGNNV